MRRNDDKRPSESFIAGAVALVFLVIGYQVAVFVHRAAVMKIVANRDEPDTVYVFESALAMQTESGIGQDEKEKKSVSQRSEISAESSGRTSVRKNAGHSPKAEAVRENYPVQKVESFRFDPNTATEDIFCRLGFSPRQARAIVSYRLKGGRFRRKEDFAKSFVVSDSIYRRLEPYIDIPLLDLNLADSAALDGLPGIGGWFALKIIEHRRQLKGFSCKEQLMDIWKFDRQKYDALSDLVTVDPAYVTPYQLWTYPADSLRRHPYIRNYEIARSIVIFRETTPCSEWSVEKLSAAGILSESAAEKLSRCVIASP